MDRKHHSAILVAVLLVTSHLHVVRGTEYEKEDYIKCGGAAAAGGVAAAVLLPIAAGILGFTPAGILAGSFAAKLMGLSWASGYGTSAIATLQSVGAAGVGGGTVMSASTASCLAALKRRKEKRT